MRTEIKFLKINSDSGYCLKLCAGAGRPFARCFLRLNPGRSCPSSEMLCPKRGIIMSYFILATIIAPCKAYLFGVAPSGDPRFPTEPPPLHLQNRIENPSSCVGGYRDSTGLCRGCRRDCVPAICGWSVQRQACLGFGFLGLRALDLGLRIRV